MKTVTKGVCTQGGHSVHAACLGQGAACLCSAISPTQASCFLLSFGLLPDTIFLFVWFLHSPAKRLSSRKVAR